jgi:type I restriction enzyme S subunit
MAKLIYDYWFVQFDFPDANGKPYKSSGGKMVYNKDLNRETPDGWIVTKVGKALNTDLGGTPSTKVKEYWTGDIPWLNSGEIANFPIIEAEEHINSNAIDNSATSLMPKGTCALSITRHLRPTILAVDACANQSVVGIYENEEVKSSFIYPYLVNEIPRLMSLRTGAQQPHINKGIVDASPIVLPPKSCLNAYYAKVNSIYDQINNLALQNKELTELRGWLLPMLMNGQVTVKEA